VSNLGYFILFCIVLNVGAVCAFVWARADPLFWRTVTIALGVELLALGLITFTAWRIFY
jgi:hypothetical protein